MRSHSLHTGIVTLSLVLAVAVPAAIAEEKYAITGSVVDADGQPVAKIAVTAHFKSQSVETATDAKGQFRLEVPRSWLKNMMVLATHKQGQLQAFQREWGEENWKKVSALRLQLAPVRAITIHVVDKKGQPVPKARFGVIASGYKFAVGETDAKGQAKCLIPSPAKPETICAWKSGLGLDYQSYENYKYRPGIKKNPEQPDGPVVLKLEGAQTVQVHVVGEDGKPVANVPVSPWYVQKPDNPGDANLSYFREEAQVHTNDKGIAVFDWLPAWETDHISFWPRGEKFAARAATYYPKKDNGTLTMKVERTVPMRGTVTFPDGKPAADIRVAASGAGYAHHNFHGEVTTDKEGRFEFMAYPNEIYIVAVRDKKWAAPPHTDFAVWPNKPVEGLNFKLQPATRVSGIVSFGPEKKPLSGQLMWLYQKGRELDTLKKIELPNPENSKSMVLPRLGQSTKTDKDGRYEFFVGPGEYSVWGPEQSPQKSFTVTNEKTLTFDFHSEREEEGELTGTVIASNTKKPVAGALITGMYRAPRASRDLEIKADDKGQFQVTRKLHKTVLYAQSPDKKLAGVIEISADAKTVTIPIQPLGSATGRLVDHEGKPLEGKEIWYGVKVPEGDDNAPWRTAFGGKIKTGKDGNFSLPNLVVGPLYHINVRTGEYSSRPVGKVQVENAKPIALGNLTLPAPYKPPTLQDRIDKAFQSKDSLPKRLASAVADARLAKQHVMLIFAENPVKPEVKQFYQLFIEDQEIRHAFDPYKVVNVIITDKKAAMVKAFAKELKIDLENRTWPLFCVLNEQKAQIALIEAAPLMKDGKIDRDALLKFLKAHAPKPLDAKQLLADTLAQAKKENKRVLVQETATWCPPCWLLSRYLDQHRDIWSKDYIWIKMDHRWTGAADLMKSLRKEARGGIPWTAILDSGGKVLATSNDAKGDNIGFPSEPPGIQHFMSMLQSTSQRLTEQDLAKLRKALEKN